MPMLKLNSNVEKLEKLSNAIEIPTDPMVPPDFLNSLIRQLADFRVEQPSLPDETPCIDSISIREIMMKKLYETRGQAEHSGKEVWIE